MIHDKWMGKFPSLAVAANTDDDSFLLMGTSETRGNVGICSDPTKLLGEELALEAAAAKERRKARGACPRRKEVASVVGWVPSAQPVTQLRDA